MTKLIPRFIYHLTTKSNYNKMLTSGSLMTSCDDLFGQGICTVDLTNLFKRWRDSKTPDNDLISKLITQISKNENEIVMLRIPTNKLDKSKLFIRSQNRLFNWSGSPEIVNMRLKLEDVYRANPQLEKIIPLKEALKELLVNSGEPNLVSHLTKGSPAKQSKLYKQRKESIEYIYRENIAIDKIEKIGDVNFKDLVEKSDYLFLRDQTKCIFEHLVKDTPEELGFKALYC